MDNTKALKWLRAFQDNIVQKCEEITPKHQQAIEVAQYCIDSITQRQKAVKKTGSWIEVDSAGYMECPFCSKRWWFTDNCTEDFDYCPKCGADMGGNK